MTTFIIFCIVTVLGEILRRYIFFLRCADWKTILAYAGGSGLIASTVLLPGAFLHSWFFNISAFILTVLFDYLITLFSWEINPQAEKMAKGKWWLSYIIPALIFITFFCIMQEKNDQKFEQLWEQTPVATIIQDPIIAGNGNSTKIIFETDNSGDIVQYVDDRDNLDQLKLEKGDQIKFLKITSKKRFEIITLRGEAYKK